jgi:hypothetical protein
MNMKDATSKYVAAREAALTANAATVRAADKAYRARRELDHLDAMGLLAADDYEQAKFAHEAAAGMEHWANDSLTMAKAALAKAVKDNVPNRVRIGGAS